MHIFVFSESGKQFLLLRKGDQWALPTAASPSTICATNALRNMNHFGDRQFNAVGGKRIPAMLVRVKSSFYPNEDHCWVDLDNAPKLLDYHARAIYGRVAPRLIPQSIFESDEKHTVDIPSPLYLTTKEYLKKINRGNEYHDSSSYDMGIDDLNWVKKDSFPILINRVKLRGEFFEVRMEQEEIKYSVTNDKGEYVRDENGNLIRYTKEQLKELGYEPYRYNFAIFNEAGQCVATFGDEWGAVLIVVAREYRGYGLGPLIGKIGRSKYPYKDSGGFTSGGKLNATRIHREFVASAAQQGFYNREVRSGRMSAERAKEIINSITARPVTKDDDSMSRDKSKWMFFSPDDATLAVYSQNLVDYLERDYEYDGHMADKAIKGYVHAIDRGNRITLIGGASDDDILNLMVYHMANKFPDLTLSSDFPVDRLKDVELENMGVRYNDEYRVISAPNIDLTPLTIKEKKWRKSFDRYDEFLHMMWDKAHSQFEE